jgi:hypothetical protein
MERSMLWLRPEAFDLVLDRNVYARADSNEPQDV